MHVCAASKTKGMFTMDTMEDTEVSAMRAGKRYIEEWLNKLFVILVWKVVMQIYGDFRYFR